MSILLEYIVPTAKPVGADLLEVAAQEFADVVSGRVNFKTTTKSMGRKTLRKQLGKGGNKQLQAESFQQKLQEKVVAKRHFCKHFSIILSSFFRYKPFLAVSGNFGRKIPLFVDVLSSHEQEV